MLGEFIFNKLVIIYKVYCLLNWKAWSELCWITASIYKVWKIDKRKNSDQGYSKSLNSGIIIPSFWSVLFFHFTQP